MTPSKRSIAAASLLCAGAMLFINPGRADAVNVGDVGPLFETVDENLQPVDMATLVDGRPLVIIVGSAS